MVSLQSSFLSYYPSPPSRIQTFKPKSCGRVLTSSENLLMLEEKEKRKGKSTERERKSPDNKKS